MSERLSLAVIDHIEARVHPFVTDYRKRLKGCHFSPLTQGFLSVVACEPGTVPESHYDWLGDFKGWEVLEGDN